MSDDRAGTFGAALRKLQESFRSLAEAVLVVLMGYVEKVPADIMDGIAVIASRVVSTVQPIIDVGNFVVETPAFRLIAGIMVMGLVVLGGVVLGLGLIIIASESIWGLPFIIVLLLVDLWILSQAR